MVPTTPEKTASLPFVHATADVPLNHFSDDVSQVPVPPRPAPVVVLLLAALASLSQYRVTAEAVRKLLPRTSTTRPNKKAPTWARSIIQLPTTFIVAVSSCA